MKLFLSILSILAVTQCEASPHHHDKSLRAAPGASLMQTHMSPTYEPPETIYVGGDPATWGPGNQPKCPGVVCPMDMCPDGLERRKIGRECCACPGDADNGGFVGGNPATWGPGNQPKCPGVVCPADVCPDGLSRRKIGDNCCACPGDADNGFVGGNPATWGPGNQPKCPGVVCPMDICPDGLERRKIGTDCCACPSGGGGFVGGNPAVWGPGFPSIPGFPPIVTHCSNVRCSADVCPDGVGRRKIGDDCCACPATPKPPIGGCAGVMCDACPRGTKHFDDGTCCGACITLKPPPIDGGCGTVRCDACPPNLVHVDDGTCCGSCVEPEPEPCSNVKCAVCPDKMVKVDDATCCGTCVYQGGSPIVGGCAGTRHGCCDDEVTAKADEAGTNCVAPTEPPPPTTTPPPAPIVPGPILPPTGSGGNPVNKVISMLEALSMKVYSEMKAAESAWLSVVDFCTKFPIKIDFEIKAAEQEIEELKATIDKETATISSCNIKIDELSGDISKNEADLAGAVKVREEEEAEFKAKKTELEDTIALVSRAIVILQRELGKGSASMLQLPKAVGVTQALAILVQASNLGANDGAKLSALLQSFQNSDDDSLSQELAGAPAAAVYESKSGTIVETLEDILQKARAQLDAAEKAEMNNIHNFEVLKASIEDEIATDTKSLKDVQMTKSQSMEELASAKSDLAVTIKELAEDKKTKETTIASCITKKKDYESEKASAEAEMEVLAKAKEILADAAGAASHYGLNQLSHGSNQVSLLQESKTDNHLTSRMDLANFELVRFVRDLANKDGSHELSLLASRIASAVRMGATTNQDPFAKVKKMITDMIRKLEKQQSADAEQRAYCEKAMADTEAKKDAKSSETDALKVKIDKISSKYSTLQVKLSELAKEVQETTAAMYQMTQVRQQEKALFKASAPQMKLGIEAVKKAIAVIKDYYSAGSKNTGAAGEIVSILETVQADFTKGLVEMKGAEASAENVYDKQMKEYKLTMISKEAEIKYKTKELTALKRKLSQLSSDLASVEDELDAVTEYYSRIKESCTITPESYASKAAKREAEIAGLKEALKILSDNESFLQQKSRIRFLSARS